MKRSYLKRGTSQLKRTEWKRVPGTARVEKPKYRTLKAKPESAAQKRFKREVRERDNWTCQFPGCGYQSKSIDVHHKCKRSQRPDLKLDPSRACCLCRQHHQWIDYNHDEAVRLGLLDLESYEAAKKLKAA